MYIFENNNFKKISKEEMLENIIKESVKMSDSSSKTAFFIILGDFNEELRKENEELKKLNIQKEKIEKEIKNGYTFPEKGRKYLYIGSYGSIIPKICIEEALDTVIIKNCIGYFEEEQAKEINKKQKLQRFLYSWKIKYDNVDGNFYIANNGGIKHAPEEFKEETTIYFSTQEKARRCIEWLKSEGMM